MSSGKTTGVILQSKEFFEKDRLVTVFTKDFGLIRLLVKGASSKSFRYGARLEPLTYVQLSLRKGKSFYYLSSVDILEAFSALKQDYNRLLFSFYCCDILKKLCVYEQENPALLASLLETLQGINRGEDIKSRHHQFCLDVLKIEGLISADTKRIRYPEFEKLFVTYTGALLELPKFIDCGQEQLKTA